MLPSPIMNNIDLNYIASIIKSNHNASLSSNQQNTVLQYITKIDKIHNKNFQWVSNIVKQMMNLNLEEDFTDVRAFNWKDFLHYPNTVVLKKC